MKLNMAKKMEKLAKNTAVKAVDKSLAIGLYEVEMPKVLKNKK